MKKLTILTLAAATMFAPMVLAGHRDDGRFYGPRANRMVVLSENLMDATYEMRHDLRKRRGHQWGVRELAVTLEQLERDTDRLRRAAIRDARPRQLEFRLDEVIRAFNRVDRRMRFVRSGRLHRDFDRIEHATRSLARHVTIATGPRNRRGSDGLRGSIVIGDRRGGGLHGSVVLGDRDDRYRVRVRF